MPASKKSRTSRPVTGERIHWLLERCYCGDNKITDEQVERFGRYPAGPIVPDNMIGFATLPRDGAEMVAADPMGRPYVGYQLHNHTWGFFHEDRWQEIDFGRDCSYVELLGFDEKSGAPILYIWSAVDEMSSVVFHSTEPIIELIGNRTVFRRRNGNIVTAEPLQIENRQSLTRITEWNANGEAAKTDGLATHWSTNWRRFVEDDDGHLHYFHQYGSINLSDGVEHDDRGWPGDVVYTPRGFLRISHGHPLLYAMSMAKPEEKIALGTPLYLHGFTELGDGRIAYVGAFRDKTECMVVDGQPITNLDHLSTPFQRDGKWLYYGVIGRHLFTFEIPPKAS